MSQASNDQAPGASAERSDAQDASFPLGARAAEDLGQCGSASEMGLAQKCEEYQAQANDYRDKYLRSVAEFSNYRKRQDRERQLQVWRTHAGILRTLLDPIDDFHRALEHVPSGEADSSWVQGIMLIEQKLMAILCQYNVTQMETVGKPFDPNFHEALLREPSDVFPEGTVTEELKKGYLMDDQVLRPAVVKVSQGADYPEQ